MANRKLENEIKEDLLDQLDRNGTTGKYYIDLVCDYINLVRTKNLLQDDIDERGASTTYNNGGGQSGYKKNDSIDQQLKVFQQMIKLLDAMGIKPSQRDGDGDEEM